jgi:hypothetical protein
MGVELVRLRAKPLWRVPNLVQIGNIVAVNTIEDLHQMFIVFFQDWTTGVDDLQEMLVAERCVVNDSSIGRV